jgi:hypothetical protein
MVLGISPITKNYRFGQAPELRSATPPYLAIHFIHAIKAFRIGSYSHYRLLSPLSSILTNLSAIN